MSHRPERRAQAVAALLSGSTWRDVSARFRVSQSTLARWLDDVHATPGKNEGARRRAVREAFKDQVGEALLPHVRDLSVKMAGPSSAELRRMTPGQIKASMARQDQNWDRFIKLVQVAQALGIV